MKTDMQAYPFHILPLILSDIAGTVIFINDAAHKSCAAINYGDNIFEHFPSLDEAMRRARAASLRSFTLPKTKYGDIMFDLSFEIPDGIIRIYPPHNIRQVTNTQALSYKSIELEFLRAAAISGHEGARRVTELYDALSAARSPFFRETGASTHKLQELLTLYFDSALPAVRHIRHRLILRCGSSVTGSTLINCDAYAFFLLISALAASVGFAARGDIVIEAEHTGERAIISVSADMRANIVISDTASFGVHAPDVIFAKTLARASGAELLLDTSDRRISFTVRMRAGEYYSEYLKENTGEDYFLRIYAASASKLITI